MSSEVFSLMQTRAMTKFLDTWLTDLEHLTCLKVRLSAKKALKPVETIFIDDVAFHADKFKV